MRFVNGRGSPGLLTGAIPVDCDGGVCLNAHLGTGEGRDWRRGKERKEG